MLKILFVHFQQILVIAKDVSYVSRFLSLCLYDLFYPLLDFGASTLWVKRHNTDFGARFERVVRLKRKLDCHVILRFYHLEGVEILQCQFLSEREQLGFYSAYEKT